MSATGRSEASAPPASEAAAQLRAAGLVRLVAAPDGDAVAATGVLARALADAEVAFQASVPPVGADADGTTDADLTVTVGRPGGDLALLDEPVAARAWDIASELGAGASVLALAGVVAAGDAPEAHDDLLSAADLDRGPGLAVPEADLADGLAHTTLVHGPFSADASAASRLLAAAGVPGDEQPADPARRRLASGVAVETVRAAPPRAAHAVERLLRPYRLGEPFATLGGYADVLDATARRQPGTAVALALGHDVRATALAAWRDHGVAAHEALAGATSARHDGVTVVEAGAAPLGTVARLARDFRAKEPVAMATGERSVAVAGASAVAEALRAAAPTDAATLCRGTTGRAVDVDPDAVVNRFREAI